MSYSIFYKNKGLPRDLSSRALATLEAKRSGGFTLIELIVVITIATIIMTSLVIRQNNWNDNLTVTTQAYELALMIRQAQSYSLGVREDTSGNGDKFNIGYGIYLTQSNRSQYIFFADRNGNKKYDAGETKETKTFTRGVTIKDVCGSTRCFFAGGGPLWQSSILFFRPDPTAIISLLNNGGNSVDTPPVTISLQSAGGEISSIKVESNGQVSIQ